LAVLKKVGVVSLERRGRTRVYRLEARELRVVYDWAGQFEKYWGQQIGRIKERAEKAESMQQ
jgi:hypothetical protein